jgi:hypothetical protein
MKFASEFASEVVGSDFASLRSARPGRQLEQLCLYQVSRVHDSDQFHLHWLRPQLNRILLPPMGKPCIFSIALSASGLRMN